MKHKDKPAPGTRIKCVTCNDSYTYIAPGTLGKVVAVDDSGTVHVEWDNGRRLGLVTEDGDQWEVV